MSAVFHVDPLTPLTSDLYLYICVTCAKPLKHEHQVCCEACYVRLVRRWLESLS